MSHELELERRDQANETPVIEGEDATIMMPPPIGEEYWTYRVKLSDTQAVLGFPKYFTIGIGFAVEEDWNTNLPYEIPTMEIFEHIRHNKGDDSIADDDVIAAIKMIQDAVRAEGR